MTLADKGWFILFFELQYFVSLTLIGSIYASIIAQKKMMKTLNYYWKGLKGRRITQYIMDWAGLQSLDLFIWKVWCIIAIVGILLICIVMNLVSFIIICIIAGWLFGYTHF